MGVFAISVDEIDNEIEMEAIHPNWGYISRKSILNRWRYFEICDAGFDPTNSILGYINRRLEESNLGFGENPDNIQITSGVISMNPLTTILTKTADYANIIYRGIKNNDSTGDINLRLTQYIDKTKEQHNLK